MGKTLAEMTAEIREVVIGKGFRPAEGGPGTNTWGDYVALLHSEISEMLEAFRSWKMKDATGSLVGLVRNCPQCGEPGAGFINGSAFCNRCDWQELPKPEGVGSEAADVLIRLLDMFDVYGIKPFDMDFEIGDVSPNYPFSGPPSTLGGWNAWLHRAASKLYPNALDIPPETASLEASHFLRAFIAFTETYHIDVMAEYERKLAYNRTREWRHGGRVL